MFERNRYGSIEGVEFTKTVTMNIIGEGPYQGPDDEYQTNTPILGKETQVRPIDSQEDDLNDTAKDDQFVMREDEMKFKPAQITSLVV